MSIVSVMAQDERLGLNEAVRAKWEVGPLPRVLWVLLQALHHNGTATLL